MSHSEEADNGNNCEFKWGKIIGHGRQWKDVKYYESFTYDGVEYFLYDCVYLRTEDEPEPFIGKLVKIWDHPNYKKRVTVVWFFRPVEITNWQGDTIPHKNEIFLASGEGKGLVNINPVEALVGKCNVVCTSQDKRNPQPSIEQVEMAEYIFFRTFDVGKFTVSEKLENRIAGIEATYFFNRKEYLKLIRDSEPKGEKQKKSEASGIEKDGVRAPISEAEDNAKLSSVKDLHNVGPYENSLFEKIRLADSAKHSLEQELNVFPPSEIEKVLSTATRRKPRMSIRDVGKSFGSHVRTSVHEGKVGTSHIRTSEHEGEVGGSYVTTSEHDPEVNSSKDFVGRERLLSSKEGFLKKETMPYRKTTPELAQEKDAKNDIQYRKMGSLVKGFVRRDGGISRTMDLSKRTTKLSDKEAPEPARDKGTKTDLQYLRTKDPDRIEKGMKEPVKGFLGLSRGISNTVNLSKKITRFSDKEAPEPAEEKGNKIDSHTVEINQRPDVPQDRSKWFKQLPWEERMDNAYQKGSLVLLQNLDPSYTSAEIENMIWSIFGERCTAKVLQQSTFSSPHNGQALMIFKTGEKAEMIMTELCKRCLMLPNGRPLIAQPGPARVVPEKPSKFFGHLTIDRINFQKQREQKRAVSTSHLTQANTIEYDMAVEWLLLQKQWEATWEALYKKQGKELAELKGKLKHL